MEKGPQLFPEDSSKMLSEDSVRIESIIVEISSDSSEDDENKGKETSPTTFYLVILPSNIGLAGKKRITLLP